VAGQRRAAPRRVEDKRRVRHRFHLALGLPVGQSPTRTPE
jgi:hypothetical protein